MAEDVPINERGAEFLATVAASFNAYYDDRIPLALQKLVVAIEDRGVETEGIYRLSGSHTKIKTIQEQCFDLHTSELITDADIHDLTGAMKAILREMVPPLLTYDLYDRLLASVANPDETQHTVKLMEVLYALPDKNFAKAYFVFQHLQR